MKPKSADITIRRYRRADQEFVERCLDSQAREKARKAPLRDIIPWGGFGKALVADLRRSVLRRKGLFLFAEVRGQPAGFAVGAPILEPAWIRRGWSFSRPIYILESYSIPRLRRLRIEEEVVKELERRFARRGFDFVITAHHAGDPVQSGVLRRTRYRPVANLVGKRLAKKGTGRRA